MRMLALGGERDQYHISAEGHFGTITRRYQRSPAPHDRPYRAGRIVATPRWPAATQLVRRSLERLGVPYDYVDLELPPEASRQLRWLTGDQAHHPTVYIGGELLVEPTPGGLHWALSRGGSASAAECGPATRHHTTHGLWTWGHEFFSTCLSFLPLR